MRKLSPANLEWACHTASELQRLGSNLDLLSLKPMCLSSLPICVQAHPFHLSPSLVMSKGKDRHSLVVERV